MMTHKPTKQKNITILVQLIISLFILVYVSATLANVSMRVNEKQISINDTLTLTLTSDQTSISGQPNLQPLQKDFNLLSTEHRVNYQFINGVAQSTNEWILILLPKHTGKVVIPPLSIGQESAQQSIIIDISAQSTTTQFNQNINNENIFIKTKFSPAKAYVNAQILYTVKVYNRFHLIDVEYTPPQAEDALIIPLARGNQYQASHNQKIYAVEELQYAIFPSKPGKLNITPPSIKGLLYDLVPQRVHAEAQKVELDVSVLPAGAEKLIPANQIILEDKFEQSEKSYTQGDSITRTIKIKAYGLPSSLIPNLNFDGNGFSAYPNTEDAHDEQDAQGIVGEKTIKVSYLLNQSGKVTIPELRFTWFNTRTQQTETTTIPAHAFSVTPDAKLNTTNNSTSSSPIQQTTAVTQQSIGEPNIIINKYLWIVLSIIGVLIGIVLCILIYKSWKTRRINQQTNNQAQDKINISVRNIKQQLKQACINRQPKQAANELLKWANTRWPKQDFLHLKQVAVQCQDPRLAQEIKTLTEILYRPINPVRWEGEKLWDAFDEYTRQNIYGIKHPKNALPELNPR